MLFPKTGGINSWYGTFVALLLVWITISLPAQNEGVNYGSPILETERDRARWEQINERYQDFMSHPNNVETNLWLGKYYYWEYVLENAGKPSDMDWLSYYYEGSFPDHSPVVHNPADSALKYFYRTVRLNPATDIFLLIYMPILQLEQYLHQPHNPLVELPYDTVKGVHFPYSYFINCNKDSTFDAGIDYLMSAPTSYFWVSAFSRDLKRMQEPVLYDMTLQDNQEVFRCTFFPSFHPVVSFRISKDKNKVTIVWKILETKYNSDNPEKKNYSLKKGELSLTPAQYEQFFKHFEKVRLDEQPRIYNAEVLDGAQWLIERKTDNGFKAFLTNDAGQEIYDLFDFLFQECRIKENSQRHY